MYISLYSITIPDGVNSIEMLPRTSLSVEFILLYKLTLAQKMSCLIEIIVHLSPFNNVVIIVCMMVESL